uniref:Uncharacterized protein n=1 Tax=Arundo donax TaxID=35708 RepID=A0A0A9GW05_ARUDO
MLIYSWLFRMFVLALYLLQLAFGNIDMFFHILLYIFMDLFMFVYCCLPGTFN